MKRIDLFRAGSHVAMSGATIPFSEADVTAIAAAYDPSVHEAPLVVGHPKHDAPAYGWVESLSAEGGRLSATPHQVNPEFAEQVDAGAYKKVSASFYAPDAAGNPTPGQYHLRHIGFLGAQPPAVKGLQPIEFADDAGDQVVTIEFGEEERSRALAWAMRTMGGMLQRIREHIVEKEGQEVADRVIGSYESDSLKDTAAQVLADLERENPGAMPAFAELPEGEPERIDQPAEAPPAEIAEVQEAEALESDPDPAPEPMEPDAAAAAFAEREQSLQERADDLAQREASFAERERSARRTDDETRLDALIGEGRLAPGYRGQVLQFLEGLDATGVVSFAEGEAETPRDFFLGLIARGKPVIDFGEASEPSPTPTNGDLVARRATRTREIVDAAIKDGRTLSFAEAALQAEREEEPR